MTINPARDVLLPGRAVRRRYGDVSEMTIWRWERNADLAFPEPIRINGRKYWRLADLEGWEIRQAANAA